MHDYATMPDWECQRAFLAVLTTGSLSAAARALNLSQPTVRRRIEMLEQSVGTPLFVRSPVGLEPTPTAAAMGEHVRAMALSAEAFMRTASGETEAASGTVRITASEVVGVEVLPPMLAALSAQYPDLVLELGLNNRSEDLLRREADIAVRMVRPTQQALVARRVGSVPLGLFSHRKYLERDGTPQNMADLRNFKLIGYENETVGVRALRAQGLDLYKQDFSFRTDSDLGQLAAIRAGLGIGVCHCAIAARHPDLMAVLPGQVSFDLETWLVIHEDQRHVRRIRLVFDALVDGLIHYIS